MPRLIKKKPVPAVDNIQSTIKHKVPSDGEIYASASRCPNNTSVVVDKTLDALYLATLKK